MTHQHDADAPAPTKQRPGDQPLPVRNDLPFVQDAVIVDIEARKQVGIERYGTPLQAFNGRDALQDAYEEAIDLTMYLKQLLIRKDGKKMSTTDQRVAAGAEWLDRVLPGWERRIDLATLDMADGCRCVLGQAMAETFKAASDRIEWDFSPYDYARRTLPWPGGDEADKAHGVHRQADKALGFYRQADFSEWADLEAAWAALIKQRFDGGALSDGDAQ